MDTVTARTGRVALFVHEPSREPPAVVEKWSLHEASILGTLNPTVRRGVVPAPAPGAQWVVWRLLSGNNREIGRGVGAYPTIEAARRAAERAVALAEDAEPLLAFDRKSAHAWCLQADATPLLISPTWHRSRRTNRLNLETVRITLGTAELNGSITALDAYGRRAAR